MTKRFTLSVLLVFFCFALAQAQLTKGTRFLGTSSGGAGNLLYTTPLAVYGGLGEASYPANDDNNLLILSVSPQAGYFLSDHVLLGSSVLLTFATDFDETSTFVGAAPFLRYYFNPESTSGTHFYGQGQIGYTISLDDTDINATPFSLGLGVTHMLGRGVGLDGFAELRSFDLGTDGSSSISLGASINVFLNDSTYQNRSTASANLQARTLMVGGSGALVDFGLEEEDGSLFAIQPQLFYFVSPQFAVGGGVRMEFSRRDFGGADFTTTNLGFSPQVRYYFDNSGHQLWFISGGININYDRQKNDFFGNDNVFSETTADFAFGAGVNTFLAPNIALEVGPSIRIDTPNEAVRVGVDVGVQAFLRTGN